MSIKISVKKADILNEVGKITAYTATKADDTGALFDKVSATEDDREMLEVYFREAVSNIVVTCGKYVKSHTEPQNPQIVDASEILSLFLNMPSNYDDGTNSTLEANIRLYFINHIIYRWFLLLGERRAEMYMEITNSYAEQIKTALCKRIIPIR